MPLLLPEGKTMKFVLSEFMHKQFAKLQLFRVSKHSLHLLLIAVLSIPDINRVSSAINLSFSPGKARAMSLTYITNKRGPKTATGVN